MQSTAGAGRIGAHRFEGAGQPAQIAEEPDHYRWAGHLSPPGRFAGPLDGLGFKPYVAHHGVPHRVGQAFGLVGAHAVVGAEGGESIGDLPFVGSTSVKAISTS